MGWMDNCQTCGGHPNEHATTIHAKGCPELQANQTPSPFMVGTILNLVILAIRVDKLERGEPFDQTTTGSTVDRAFNSIVLNYPSDLDLDFIQNEVVNAVLGGS